MDSKNWERPYECDECPSAFTTTFYLKNHKSSVHSELRPFQCDHCDYRAKLKSTLRWHYATHFPEKYKTHHCPQCPFMCIKQSQLQAHLRVHTKERPFLCKMCPYKAPMRFVLTTHMRSHTGEKPFKCTLCPSTFSQGSNLDRHKLFIHNKKDVCLIPCSFPGCKQEFAFKYALRRHVESFHNKERRFYCPYCEKSFYEKPYCVSHIRHRHTKERPFKCSVCEYAATTSTKVKVHESTTHGEYMAVECQICHRKYKNKLSLATHHIQRHKNADRGKEAALKLKCKESGCTKEYKSRNGLKLHVNSVHLQQRPFSCLFCEHRTTRSSSLNAHLKTHTGEKPYNCDLCKRCFTSGSELRTHKATAHSKLKPFECEQCSFSSKTKECLKQHVKRHKSMPTAFECSVCKDSQCSLKPRDYSFLSKSSLNVHMRNTHFQDGILKRLLTPQGSKGVAVPKRDSGCIKVIHTASDCTLCFVRLVKIKELKRDPLCKTPIRIYA